MTDVARLDFTGPPPGYTRDERRTGYLRDIYTIDQSAHDCGEIGSLAQHRDRVLIVARQPEVAQDYLRRPPKQRVRAVGEVLGLLPSPVSDHGDEMHEQPWCSPMTWLRLACADPDKVVSPRSKGDWRDIPAALSSLHRALHVKHRRVLCVESGIVHASIAAAARALGVHHRTASRAIHMGYRCRGQRLQLATSRNINAAARQRRLL